MNIPISGSIRLLRLILDHTGLFQGRLCNAVLKDDFMKLGKMCRHKNEHFEDLT